MDTHFVYVTVSGRAEAEKIARALVSKHLAACVNILPGMTSIYEWEGQILEDSEVALIAKTAREKVTNLIDEVKALHSFACPCIVSWPITGGHLEYIEWVSRQTRLS